MKNLTMCTGKLFLLFFFSMVNFLVAVENSSSNSIDEVLTENISLNGYYLSNDGGNEGITVENDGDVVASSKLGIGINPTEKLTIGTTYGLDKIKINNAIFGTRLTDTRDAWTSGLRNYIIDLDSDTNDENAALIISHNNDINSQLFRVNENGKLGVNTTNINSTIDIVSLAESTSRESIIKATVSDATGYQFGIKNSTYSTGIFEPAFYGTTPSSTRHSLIFQGMTTSEYDIGNVPLITFIGQLHSGDPINGTFTTVNARPLFRFTNFSTPLIDINAGGDLNLLTGKIILNSNFLSGDGDDEGIKVENDGDIFISNKIGIGISPDYSFQIKSASPVIWFSEDDVNMDWSMSVANGNFYIQEQSGTSKHLFIRGSNYVNIFDINLENAYTQINKLGINMESTHTLDINGSIGINSNGLLKGRLYYNSGLSTMLWDAYNGNDWTTPVGIKGNNIIFLDESDNVSMSINTDNQVTVNKELVVNNKIKAQEIQLQQESLPDYVFKDDYDLMSIEETEAFIHQNKHLPGIPSADEATNKGIDIGEFQANLLQKIEELTLYVIELKKENDSIKKENSEIKKWIKTIQNN